MLGEKHNGTALDLRGIPWAGDATSAERFDFIRERTDAMHLYGEDAGFGSRRNSGVRGDGVCLSGLMTSWASAVLSNTCLATGSARTNVATCRDKHPQSKAVA